MADPEEKTRFFGAEELQMALQVIGAAAALTAWIILLGGVQAYSRLRAAGLPDAVRTAALLPREQLLAEGFRLLAMPLAVGVLVAALAYMAGHAGRLDWWGPSLVGPVAFGVVVFLAVTLAVTDQIRHPLEFLWTVAVVILSLALGALAVLALLRWTGPIAVALTIFVLVFTWGGVNSMFSERGRSRSPFEPTQVRLKDGTGVRGLPFARSRG